MKTQTQLSSILFLTLFVASNLLFPDIEFKSASISLTNLSGQVIFDKEVPGSKEFTIPVYSMPNGIYTLRVVLNNGKPFIKKVTISH